MAKTFIKNYKGYKDNPVKLSNQLKDAQSIKDRLVEAQIAQLYNKERIPVRAVGGKQNTEGDSQSHSETE